MLTCSCLPSRLEITSEGWYGSGLRSSRFRVARSSRSLSPRNPRWRALGFLGSVRGVPQMWEASRRGDGPRPSARSRQRELPIGSLPAQAEVDANRGGVVDVGAVAIFFAEEDVLVASNTICEAAIGEGGASATAASVQCDDIVPVARESIVTAKFAPSTEHMDGGGLLPECPFGPHDGGCDGRKDHVWQVGRRVTGHWPGLGGLAG